MQEQIVCRYGVSLKVLTDQGKCFESQLAKEVYDIMGTKHVRTTAYHPATNILTEKFNKTLAAMISMYISKHQKDWDRWLPFVCFAYNNSEQVSTKLSLFLLLHGFFPKMLRELNLNPQSIGIERAEDYAQLVTTFLEAKRGLAAQSGVSIDYK